MSIRARAGLACGGAAVDQSIIVAAVKSGQLMC